MPTSEQPEEVIHHVRLLTSLRGAISRRLSKTKPTEGISESPGADNPIHRKEDQVSENDVKEGEPNEPVVEVSSDTQQTEGLPNEGPTDRDWEGGLSSEPSLAPHYLQSGQTQRPEDDTTTKPLS